MVNLSETVPDYEFPEFAPLKNESIEKNAFFSSTTQGYIPLHTNWIHPSRALEFNFFSREV
ncbi:hypothetical protein EG346_24200 [Chryseobacterium carnipullorum]|uniref:Uncharacterized protein n=1 Tax=Chryseobacterium carnipullorum TaxID=1124835 RepID=A0A3G6M827_CHRCU|nr:hypothetical protein EG346_24200 [Chryseobacterium carnipullorum]AZA65944.1 hypothetical protein EG345_15305 [Chryseobacterium carnipullorum]